MRDRAVVHLNIAHFAVAVERTVEPRLRRRPVIVAPKAGGRSLVYDMSEEAYQAGVRKGMPLSQAQRCCSDAFLVPPHQDRYERAMRAFWEHTCPYAPLVEWVDERGHLFLDLSGTRRLFGPPADVAWRIRREVKDDLRLEPIWSVAANKLVAKVATRLVKPTGEYIVEPGEEAEFLQPLPLEVLPGIEREELRLMRELHLARIGEVAQLSRTQLQIAVGNFASYLFDAVRGIDASPVVPAEQSHRPAQGACTFVEDTNEVAVIEGALYRLVEAAGRDLRRRGLAARRVGIALDHTDGLRRVRSASDAQGTANDLCLFALARTALYRAWTRRVRVRHLRLCCDRLTTPSGQLELFSAEQDLKTRQTHLVSTVEAIRGKFGQAAISVGRSLGAQNVELHAA